MNMYIIMYIIMYAVTVILMTSCIEDMGANGVSVRERIPI